MELKCNKCGENYQNLKLNDAYGFIQVSTEQVTEPLKRNQRGVILAKSRTGKVKKPHKAKFIRGPRLNPEPYFRIHRESCQEKWWENQLAKKKAI